MCDLCTWPRSCSCSRLPDSTARHIHTPTCCQAPSIRNREVAARWGSTWADTEEVVALELATVVAEAAEAYWVVLPEDLEEATARPMLSVRQ